MVRFTELDDWAEARSENPEAEARLAAKRAARAEAREIRMKELERQQKEIYQVQKKYYGLDTKFGDIEQWMEDSERYTHKSRRNASASDEDERMSVGSRGSLRSDLDYASAYPVAGLEKERTKRRNFKTTNGYEEDMYRSSQNRKSSRASCYSDLSLHCSDFPSQSQPSAQNGNRASLYDENFNSGNRRYSASSSRPASEYSCYLGSGSRASSRASSARASPVVEERPEKDFEKGVRTVSSLSAATLASLGGTSSRRGSGDTSISVDTEASIREIKDIHELKDQIQDVEGKYMQGLKEMKDSLAEVEEKYKKAMVSNAQLDNEKTNFMYQVDTLKDALLELEEQLAESNRQYEEKSKDFEREKHAHTILQFQFMEVKEALKQREELLAEIRQLQQKQEGYVREMSDLQETIDWKEKKIGALERQKEFFDTVRSERDDLREEVIVLKEQLKQHGIIPNSEVATNGESCSGLDNDGLSSSSKIVPGTSHVPEVTGDGTLGRANEVEMKNEIMENVGKREPLQNTEHEEHTEETKEQEIVQECSEIKTLHADETAEAEKINEGKVASTLILNSGPEESDKSHSEHVPGIVYSLESSDAVEFRGEGGPLGDTTEMKEPDGNVVNTVGNQNKIAGPGIKVNQEINTDIEIIPQEQNKEKQTDIVTNETEGNNNEVFEEALDFVSNSHMKTTSQPESPELLPSIDPNVEQNKMVESDLDRQLDKNEGITITDEAEWGKNEAGVINQENETDNVVQQQKNKLVASAVELPGTGKQKQVEIEEIQALFSKQDIFVEEEQNEQETEAREDNAEESPAKVTDQTEALFKAPEACLDSEKYEQNAMKPLLTEETVEDNVNHSECQTHEERNVGLEEDSGESKSEFIDVGKALADIATIQDETTQDSTIIASIITEDVEVHKRNEEDRNHGKAEEKVLEVLSDREEGVCLISQKAEVSDQEADNEEYHEAFDFEESSSGALKTTEMSNKQGNESEKVIHQMQEKDGIAESGEQNVSKEVYEKECKDKESLADEKKKEEIYQTSADEVVDKVMLTESENIQQQKGKEFAEHLQTDPSVSCSSEAQCEILEDTNTKILDEINSKQIAEYTSEQLAKLESSVDEDQEEALVGKKGKGKSREDCVIS
ncbi:leucine-rich repeat flightless-interacting protein 1 isoform X3 [Elgaria multicarinata webbii]|uniref:leucine-rich repeat flightless-interacting protein 1 isoform X3 n=1 Tax=Elgaria multicarinata webbii TaxID=159646 RepID=UPI002FCCE449